MDLSQYDNHWYCPGRSLIVRIVWHIVNCLVFKSGIFHFPYLKRIILISFGATVGHKCVLKPNVHIKFPWMLSVGRNSWIGEESLLLNLANISIGSNVCISQRVFLCTGNHDWTKKQFDLVVKPITILDEVWICANVFVGPGVTIGKKSVVTSGSVVTRNLPSGMICSGNPCVPIKPRKTEVSEEVFQKKYSGPTDDPGRTSLC